MTTILAIAPVIVLLVYFYCQDRYDKEPLSKLAEAFFVGMIVVLQIQYLQDLLLDISTHIAWQAFIVAGLVEEGIKLMALRFTIYRDKHFNEQVDGIIYAVFLGLGFALAETIVLSVDHSTSIVRAVTAVPAHAMFACVMGYYLGKYKFHSKRNLLAYALFVPAVLHGVYNYLLMCGHTWALISFVPYLIALWVIGIRDTDIHLRNSRFRRKSNV